MTQDFMYEQKRETVTDGWGDEISLALLAEKLNEPRVSYRIYYSNDNLTRRIFVSRGWPNGTAKETEIMLGLGFVIAQDDDADNIPDQPVEEDEIKEDEL
jgi:hypothetical protein